MSFIIATLYLLGDQGRDGRTSLDVSDNLIVGLALLDVQADSLERRCSSDLLVIDIGRLFLVHQSMPVSQVGQPNASVALSLSLCKISHGYVPFMYSTSLQFLPSSVNGRRSLWIVMRFGGLYGTRFHCRPLRLISRVARTRLLPGLPLLD